MRKPRVQIQRNTRTEVHADRRTRRLRTRTDEERAAVEDDLDLEWGPVIDWDRAEQELGKRRSP